MELTREPKKLLNLKVTVIPIGGGALGTISRGKEKRLEKEDSRLSRSQHS